MQILVLSRYKGAWQSKKGAMNFVSKKGNILSTRSGYIYKDDTPFSNRTLSYFYFRGQRRLSTAFSYQPAYLIY